MLLIQTLIEQERVRLTADNRKAEYCTATLLLLSFHLLQEIYRMLENLNSNQLFKSNKIVLELLYPSWLAVHGEIN